MESIVIRLVLPPLTVIAAGWLQRRVGPRLSGRLVGLPLTSGPLVLVLLLADGTAAAVTAAQGVLAGQVMVVGFTTAYAVGTATSAHPRAVLGAALAAVVLLGGGAHLAVERAPWTIGLLVVPLALVCVRVSSPEAGGHGAGTGPSVPQLLRRAAVTGVLVATLSTSARVIGAGLAGVLASVPLVVSVVSPATHRDSGAAAARAMLRGTLTVVPGTATFAAVLATVLPVGALAAFAAALVAMLLVNRAVAHWDATQHMPPPHR